MLNLLAALTSLGLEKRFEVSDLRALLFNAMGFPEQIQRGSFSMLCNVQGYLRWNTHANLEARMHYTNFVAHINSTHGHRISLNCACYHNIPDPYGAL